MARTAVVWVSILGLGGCVDPVGGPPPSWDGGSVGDVSEPTPCEGHGDCLGVRAAQGSCTVMLCDPVTSLCVAVGSPERAPCDDGDPCTVEDHCAAGSCGGYLPSPSLCDDGSACTTDSCVAGVGCAAEPILGPCDDGNPCTVEDTCSNGFCAGASSGLCACGADSDCAEFDDGNLCTGVLICQFGTCVVALGSPVDCPPDTPCVEHLCTSSTGACVALPRAEGGPCFDGDACTAEDVCVGGECQGTPACGCDVAEDCAFFEDGDLCNGTLGCEDGACAITAGSVVFCGGDETGCLLSVCAAETGECLPDPIADGQPCDDGDLCREGTVCLGGVCIGGHAKDCADDNPCTVGLCVADLGCEQQNLTGQPCDDGDACTSGDSCDGDVCVGPFNVCGVCGDGFCASDEDCSSCPIDCGACDAAECGNGICEDSEDAFTCPSDCGGGGGTCGDGVCDLGEQLTCPQDCAGAVCGDGICDLGEEFTCPDDCGGSSNPLCDGVCDLLDTFFCPEDCCGDGVCDSLFEDATNCPEDCATSWCGDGSCDPGETVVGCPQDCGPICGDGVCEPGESGATCPADCPPDPEPDGGATDGTDGEVADGEVGPEDPDGGVGPDGGGGPDAAGDVSDG